ncbi:MAG TPA: type II toxin-antitoxin system VapC family toxin [Thermoanaerobaculia bacterium]|nr:type II toxin-antitoxin system VapC family toxin [Thermoanaerobaculia bacterium]
MMFALDTNTVIYFFKGFGRVAERLLATPLDQIAIPVIVLYELEVGIAKSNQPEKRRGQVDELSALVRILPFGPAEARTTAQLRASLEAIGRPIGPLDTLIAGTALHHSATLVSHNLSEIGRVAGLKVEDWY